MKQRRPTAIGFALAKPWIQIRSGRQRRIVCLVAVVAMIMGLALLLAGWALYSASLAVVAAVHLYNALELLEIWPSRKSGQPWLLLTLGAGAIIALCSVVLISVGCRFLWPNPNAGGMTATAAINAVVTSTSFLYLALPRTPASRRIWTLKFRRRLFECMSPHLGVLLAALASMALGSHSFPDALEATAIALAFLFHAQQMITRVSLKRRYLRRRPS